MKLECKRDENKLEGYQQIIQVERKDYKLKRRGENPFSGLQIAAKSTIRILWFNSDRSFIRTKDSFIQNFR